MPIKETLDAHIGPGTCIAAVDAASALVRAIFSNRSGY
jgi:hypothetical protein